MTSFVAFAMICTTAVAALSPSWDDGYYEEPTANAIVCNAVSTRMFERCLKRHGCSVHDRSCGYREDVYLCHLTLWKDFVAKVPQCADWREK